MVKSCYGKKKQNKKTKHKNPHQPNKKPTNPKELTLNVKPKQILKSVMVWNRQK